MYDTRLGRIGVAICYDRHYPEYMRALAVQGAEVVLIPQAGSVGEWPEGLYEAEMRVNAFQNGYFTALCNPAGEVLARAGQGTGEILYCDLDLDEVTQSNGRRLFLRDRRPELYKDWI